MTGSDSNDAVPPIEIPPELVEKLALGEINIAQFLGLTRGTLYAIAEIGYKLMISGKLDTAKQIYMGLVAADPFDSVFRCHLAAVHHKMGELDLAREEYSKSLQLNNQNIDALAGRGEIHFNQGNFTEAFQDLKEAITLDPKGRLASTIRARAVMVAMKEVVDKHRAASQQS